MQTNNIFLYLICLLFIILIGKVFIFPLKLIFKILINSILGILLLLIINYIGQYFSFHIGINLATILIAAFLGIPGTILLAIVGL